MPAEISPAQMSLYRQTAQARQRAKEAALAQRKERAWETARRAAEILKGEYGATQVVVFGSLAGNLPFHERSDIDLAVWGLPERDYFRAVSRLLSIDPAIPIDLIEFENARARLQKVIEQEGVSI